MLNVKILINKVLKFFRHISFIQHDLDQIKINHGLIIANINKMKNYNTIHGYEFKVFSQWGEDGIIQHLTNSIDIQHKTFIEFGVEDFIESNCRFLLMKDNWSGFVVDGSKSNIDKIHRSYYFWKYHLHPFYSFLTTDNINAVLAHSNFDQDLGILSIDLDGNDYFILEAINYYKPRILICEYNSVFGPNRKISVPYNRDFTRMESHYSGLYWGASLGAINFLASKKGYALVGSNSAGNNAFFIRNDLVNDNIKVLSVDEAFVISKFRESRNSFGSLSYLSGDDRYSIISGMPVYNVENKLLERL